LQLDKPKLFSFFASHFFSTVTLPTSAVKRSFCFCDWLDCLQSSYYATFDFPPYLFEKNFETGQLTKIIDTENAFQFKTYSLASETDIESYMSNVKPVLIKWAEEDESDIGSDASTSSILSRDIIEGVEMDHLPTREVHVAIYKGKIEAVSYAEDARQTIPEIKTLIANPEGLIEGQTKIVKGGGSSLLNYTLQRFVGEKNDYYTLFVVLLFFEFGITSILQLQKKIHAAIGYLTPVEKMAELKKAT
jgi:hypothetical protein